MNTKFTIKEFNARFSTDDACLEEIKDMKYPNGIMCAKENKITKFYKVTGRPVYQCACGYQVSPLAGTIFEKSTTHLTDWFYCMYLMVQTRAGISAKQLQREIGCTYKTAWRIAKQIRMLMADQGSNSLKGIVEVDETYIGGKAHSRKRTYGQGLLNKEILMGMVERDGKAYIKHIPNTGKWTLLEQIKKNVDPKARVITDDNRGYIQLRHHGFDHDSVNHSAGEYVRGDVYTQNIENVWSHLKRGIYGVYRNVSKKYLQAYADEYAWRYNHRIYGGKMFDGLLRQVVTVKLVKA